jgi:hypothetical protein
VAHGVQGVNDILQILKGRGVILRGENETIQGVTDELSQLRSQLAGTFLHIIALFFRF